MVLKEWRKLPDEMRNAKVRAYYLRLEQKKSSLILKLLFDRVVGLIMLILLLPLMIGVAVAIKASSEGSIIFRQKRVTRYKREFEIYKFRTMIENAEKLGAQVTSEEDKRVTKIGKVLRKYRLDELPQLLNIIKGEMSFVGTRPEVVKYVEKYSEEMMATLLLPAGVTSLASIKYKDEEKLLTGSGKAEETYIKEVLPAKMEWNLKGIQEFGVFSDMKVMIQTVVAVFRG